MTPEPIQLPDSNCLIKPQVSLAHFTTFRVGGAAEWFVTPRTLEALQACWQWAHSQGLPITLLGAGSNLLISDCGLPGLVICTRYFRGATFDPEKAQITAGAGEPIVRLSWQAAKRGWQGLEWAVGVPGTVGGAVFMNAGAHQACTADSLIEAQVLGIDGTLEVLYPQDLGFSYRTSSLQTDKRLVVQARFQLQPGADPEVVTAQTDQFLKHRHTTQPYDMPSCGSVFRNPNPKAAGWLIENAGLKGFQIGGAQVAQRHANFILNLGSATASDIYRLIRHVQERVENQWSLLLEPEVRMFGEFQVI
jgi:UDP-N-acetylmuramate dehydrogenase